MDWKQITPGAEITDEVWRKLYGALCRLKDYEDTGLMPDEIERMRKEKNHGKKNAVITACMSMPAKAGEELRCENWKPEDVRMEGDGK